MIKTRSIEFRHTWEAIQLVSQQPAASDHNRSSLMGQTARYRWAQEHILP